jgi:hypothetical protein
MKGVILGIPLHDYKSELNANDLVYIKDNDMYFNLEKIDARYGKREGEPDNEYKYFVKEPVSGELMNFKRDELSKANIAVFNYQEYYENNRKIMIGNIFPEDLRNIKAKHALEWDLPFENIDKIKNSDILELAFEGEQVTKEYMAYPDYPATVVKYFKLKVS